MFCEHKNDVDTLPALLSPFSPSPPHLLPSLSISLLLSPSPSLLGHWQVDESEKMQKDVYLTLCQKFISLLGDHLARCDQQGSDYESPWFQSTLDNFRQLLIKVNIAYG